MSDPPKLSNGQTALTVGLLRELLSEFPDETLVEVWLSSPEGTTMRIAAVESMTSILELSKRRRFVIYGHKNGYGDFVRLIHWEKKE